MLNGTDDGISIHNEMMPEEEQFAAVAFASYQTGAVELDIHAVVGEKLMRPVAVKRLHFLLRAARGVIYLHCFGGLIAYILFELSVF